MKNIPMNREFNALSSDMQCIYETIQIFIPKTQNQISEYFCIFNYFGSVNQTFTVL